MDKNITQQLISIIQAYAPNAEARELIRVMFNRMYFDGVSNTEIVKALVNVLSDGINHSNWPWNRKENISNTIDADPLGQ